MSENVSIQTDVELHSHHKNKRTCQCYIVSWQENGISRNKSFLVSKYTREGARANAHAFAKCIQNGDLTFDTRNNFRLVHAPKPEPSAQELRAIINNYQERKKEERFGFFTSFLSSIRALLGRTFQGATT